MANGCCCRWMSIIWCAKATQFHHKRTGVMSLFKSTDRWKIEIMIKASYLWQGKVSTDARRRYPCHVFLVGWFFFTSSLVPHHDRYCIIFNHWGLLTHIFISRLGHHTGTGNDLSLNCPVPFQCWANTDLLLGGTHRTIFTEIRIKI